MNGPQLHEEVLQILLNYKKSHPDAIWWFRLRNTGQRLDKGYWFQGNDGYAFVGLYDRSGGTNMTRSVGLVFYRERIIK